MNTGRATSQFRISGPLDNPGHGDIGMDYAMVPKSESFSPSKT